MAPGAPHWREGAWAFFSQASHAGGRTRRVTERNGDAGLPPSRATQKPPSSRGKAQRGQARNHPRAAGPPALPHPAGLGSPPRPPVTRRATQPPPSRPAHLRHCSRRSGATSRPPRRPPLRQEHLLQRGGGHVSAQRHQGRHDGPQPTATSSARCTPSATRSSTSRRASSSPRTTPSRTRRPAIAAQRGGHRGPRQGSLLPCPAGGLRYQTARPPGRRIRPRARCTRCGGQRCSSPRAGAGLTFARAARGPRRTRA